MTVSDRCRTALRALETVIRDDHIKMDIMQRACNDVLLVDGKKPTLMEEVELLDGFISYFSSKSDEETKTRIFHEFFPLDKEISSDRLQFLVKISSLAIYLNHVPLLDLIGLWLKVRITSFYATALYPSTTQTSTSFYHTITQYVCGTVTDLLSIPGVPCGTSSCLNGMTRTDEVNDEHPLVTLPSLSAAFVDALLSGIILIYGSSPSMASLILKNSPTDLNPVGLPSTALVHCIVNWLQHSRTHPRSHHSAGSHPASHWTSVDWPSMIRRYKIHTQLPSTAEPIHAHCPPIPIGLVWWTVFWPVHSATTTRDPEDQLLTIHLAELHYELLQCLSESGPGSTGHRYGSSSGLGSGGGSSGSNSGPSVFANWTFPCSRKLERTREFAYLELLVQQAQACTLDTTDCNKNTFEDLPTPKTMMIIRLAEFMQLAWASGRIWNLSTEEFAKLLAPLTGNKLIDLIRARFKRV